jgi:hypothetical protein
VRDRKKLPPRAAALFVFFVLLGLVIGIAQTLWHKH